MHHLYKSVAADFCPVAIIAESWQKVKIISADFVEYKKWPKFRGRWDSYFFVSCGANFERRIFAKPVDFTVEKRYNENAPTIGRQKHQLCRSFFATTFYPTDRPGKHGNSGGKSAGEHRFPSGKGRKSPERAGKIYQPLFGTSMSSVQIRPLRLTPPGRLSRRRFSAYFFVSCGAFDGLRRWFSVFRRFFSSAISAFVCAISSTSFFSHSSRVLA